MLPPESIPVTPLAEYLETEERHGNRTWIADNIESMATLPALERYHAATARLRAVQ